MNCFLIIYLIVAILFSLFYGLFACSIFIGDVKDKPSAWKFHQIWLNFLGSIIGWIAFWPVINNTISYLKGNEGFPGFGWQQICLFFLGFVGITGFLPSAVVGLVTSLGKIAEKLLGYLIK
jgi:hypothetical protein